MAAAGSPWSSFGLAVWDPPDARAIGLGCLVRGRENCCDLLCLIDQRGVVPDPGVAQVLEPVNAFICFFAGNSELRFELGSRATLARGAVIGPDRVACAAKLTSSLLCFV